MKSRVRYAGLAFLIAAFHPRTVASAGPLVYVDVTSTSGVSFEHDSGPPLIHLPQIMGPACAVADYDQDGFDDLLLTDSAPPPDQRQDRSADPSADRPRSTGGSRLYRNRGGGRFEDVTALAWGQEPVHALGATWADVDGDGHPDVFLTDPGGCRLMRNLGDGTFRPLAPGPEPIGEERFWAASAWSDYDRDGRLDLYVTAYIAFSYPPRAHPIRPTLWKGREVPETLAPPLYDGQANVLLRNLGDLAFEDVTARAGVSDNDDLNGKGLGALWTDLERDGWPDLVVANDGVRKSLYLNHSGGFRSAAREAWLTDRYGSMGLVAGDVDGDLRPDLLFTNWFEEPNTLYLNRRGGLLVESSAPAGIGPASRPRVGWGAVLEDLDLDGHLDIVIACGSTFASHYRWENLRESPNLMVPQPMLAFRGDGRGHFTDVSTPWGLSDVLIAGRGLAHADLDRDGDLDLVVGENNGPFRILRCDRSRGNGRWLQVELVGRGANRAGIGAEVVLETDAMSLMREVRAGSSYLGSSPPIACFGVDPGAQARAVRVRWPSGLISRIPMSGLDRRLRVIEPGTSTGTGTGT